jgi:hypothetical protein
MAVADVDVGSETLVGDRLSRLIERLQTSDLAALEDLAWLRSHDGLDRTRYRQAADAIERLDYEVALKLLRSSEP